MGTVPCGPPQSSPQQFPPPHVFARPPLIAVIPANPCWKGMSVIPHGDVAQCQGCTGWPVLLFDWEQARVDPPLLPDWVPSQFSDEQCRSNPSWLTLMKVFVFNGRRQNVKIHLQIIPASTWMCLWGFLSLNYCKIPVRVSLQQIILMIWSLHSFALKPKL